MEIASPTQLRMSFVRWALVCVPAVLLLGFLSGRSVPAGNQSDWYVSLVKPAGTPPGWAFPVAWSVLYVLIGLALAQVLNARGAAGRGIAVALFAVQLLLNLAWTPIFFGAHRIGLALGDLLLLIVAASATTVAFRRVRVGAAWLMLPYLIWIGFAAALTWRIGQLNPSAGLVPGPVSTQLIR